MAESYLYLSNLTVLSRILSDPLIAAFAAYRNGSAKTPSLKTDFLRELYDKKAELNFSAYVADVVIKDDNAFSRACATGSDLSDYLKNAYIADLEEIGKALDFESSEFNVGKPPALIKSWDDKAANLLYGYYQSAGYGKFLSCYSFRYEREKGLVPIARPLIYPLSELKGYEKEKEEVYDNLENFVKDLPCADVLLYGDAGTGKSALLRATVAAFAGQKLRLVELAREDVRELPALVSLLSEIPLRFVVFVEALGVRVHLPDYATDNVMIAATGAAPLEGFGLKICMKKASKQEFATIVRELVKDFKVKIGAEELEALTVAWAESHDYSPRSARQLAGYLLACQKKGKEIKPPAAD